MGKRVLLGLVVLSGLFCSAGITKNLEVPNGLYIGQPFIVNVGVSDTLIVLNLRDPAKVYEFKIEERGIIELCFVRPCDHLPAHVPAERVILANPGDTILFTLKQTPMEQEIRRSVLRSIEGEKPEVLKADLVEVEGKCYFQIKVKHIGADLSCDPDDLSVSFYVDDPQKVATLTLKETGPATGEFEAWFPITELKYESQKFIVKYQYKKDSKDETAVAEVTLPSRPEANIKIGDTDTKFSFDLVKALDKELLEEIPQKFRQGDCCAFALLQGMIKRHFDPAAQVNIELIENALYVIAKEGCQYFAGVKKVEVLAPVRLVVKDEKGQELHGGSLDAGKTYTIEAINGLPEGYILVVLLKPDPDKSSDPANSADSDRAGKVVHYGKGPSSNWTPGPNDKGCVAIIYVDQYFCNPPALIFDVKQVKVS